MTEMRTIAPMEALRGCRYAVVRDDDLGLINVFPNEVEALLYVRKMLARYDVGHDREVVAIDYVETSAARNERCEHGTATKDMHTTEQGGVGHLTCSECGERVKMRDRFCWSCGAMFEDVR